MISIRTMMKTNTKKHVPLRTCIACRDIRSKRQLIRLVCDAEGGIQIDSSGKKPGRGAYLCNMPECWQNALIGNRLDRALHTAVSPDCRQRLIEYGNKLAMEG